MNSPSIQPEGLLLIDKPENITSFGVVARVRRILGVKKIGHGGTLDPFATGLLVLLVGRNFTKLADQFLGDAKEYTATVHLGITTDSYDRDGAVVATSLHIPTREDVECALKQFQGTIQQVPPMFSAKKIDGKRLYEIARKGGVVERKPCAVTVQTTLLRYEYPEIDIHVACSKGTYIRTLAYDLGCLLGCGAHLTSLRRQASGRFFLKDAISLEALKERFDAGKPFFYQNCEPSACNSSVSL